MEPGIEFRIIYRDNEVIKVRISASNGCFCGSAHVYLGTGQLADIAAQLLGFPMRTRTQKLLCEWKLPERWRGKATA